MTIVGSGPPLIIVLCVLFNLNMEDKAQHITISSFCAIDISRLLHTSGFVVIFFRELFYFQSRTVNSRKNE